MKTTLEQRLAEILDNPVPSLVDIFCLLQDQAARIRELEAQQTWQPIETAPKNGETIYIMKPEWDCAVKAKWGDYPDNPVQSETDETVCMQGWIIENEYTLAVGCEDGFLGWNEDIAEGNMPTHWMPTTNKEKREKKND